MNKKNKVLKLITFITILCLCIGLGLLKQYGPDRLVNLMTTTWGSFIDIVLYWIMVIVGFRYLIAEVKSEIKEKDRKILKKGFLSIFGMTLFMFLMLPLADQDAQNLAWIEGEPRATWVVFILYQIVYIFAQISFLLGEAFVDGLPTTWPYLTVILSIGVFLFWKLRPSKQS